VGPEPEPEVANLVPVGFELERVLSEVLTSVRHGSELGRMWRTARAPEHQSSRPHVSSRHWYSLATATWGGDRDLVRRRAQLRRSPYYQRTMPRACAGKDANVRRNKSISNHAFPK
jgi:hypothetical protein